MKMDDRWVRQEQTELDSRPIKLEVGVWEVDDYPGTAGPVEVLPFIDQFHNDKPKIIDECLKALRENPELKHGKIGWLGWYQHDQEGLVFMAKVRARWDDVLAVKVIPPGGHYGQS